MKGSGLDYLYIEALHSLAAGYTDDFTRKILSYSPLPSDFIDPYASEQCSAADALKLTYNALAVWIEQAKKCNYFSLQFVQLSKMILNSSVTMARGLISLHNRGEDLSISPMSIEDLLDVASYHFRKSYIGMMQTVESHPEISRRLLENQIRWMNMLLRLYKTQEKLKEKAVPAPCLEAGCEASAELSSGSRKPIKSAAAVNEAGALGAPQAFRPLDGSKAVPVRAAKAGSCGSAADGSQTAEQKPETAGTSGTGTDPETRAEDTVLPDGGSDSEKTGDTERQETAETREPAVRSEEDKDPVRQAGSLTQEAAGIPEKSEAAETGPEERAEKTAGRDREKFISISYLYDILSRFRYPVPDPPPDPDPP